jgi:acyl carrier protein
MSDLATTAPTGARVRQYIVDNFLYMRPGFAFSDDDFLMGRGIIDSLGVMELIGFVEEAFDVRVADEDVTEENLGSVNAIARYVDRAKAAR